MFVGHCGKDTQIYTEDTVMANRNRSIMQQKNNITTRTNKILFMVIQIISLTVSQMTQSINFNQILYTWYNQLLMPNGVISAVIDNF